MRLADTLAAFPEIFEGLLTTTTTPPPPPAADKLGSVTASADLWKDCVWDYIHWGWWWWLNQHLIMTRLCRWWAHSAWWWSHRWSCTRASTPRCGKTTRQPGTAFSAQVSKHQHWSPPPPHPEVPDTVHLSTKAHFQLKVREWKREGRCELGDCVFCVY